jgi:ribonuclease P protein component
VKRVTGRFGFPGHLRLRNHGRFERLLAEGKRGGDRQLQVWVLPNDLGFSRFGLVVGRRHGGAVQRNRIKRVLREAFRLRRTELPSGLDIACAPRVGIRVELESAMRSLVEITCRLARGIEPD